MCLQRIVVSLLGIAFVAGCGSAGTDDVLDSPETGPVSQSASATSMDDVPGLGRSPEAALRDDTIAYYEAWLRDSLVANCMLSQGEVWVPEVLFPPEMLPSIAVELDIEATPDNTEWPERVNAKRLKTLNAAELEAYMQAMYSESANDIHYWQESQGMVPEGRSEDEFAKAGCSEVGWAQIPGIWGIQKVLKAELIELESEARTTEAFKDIQGEYANCVSGFGFDGVDTPGALETEALLRSDGDPNDRAFTDANVACGPIWTRAVAAGTRAAQTGFLSANSEVIERWVGHYDELWDRLVRDEEFKTYLSLAYARALHDGLV